MSTNIETFQFQAEARQVLDLMIHSLYTNKEIFLRELISNASDALDRLRFEALSKPELIGPDERLEIWIETDPKARTLTFSDNGIGMSREEVIANIGTIAKSGTRELLQTLRERKSSDMADIVDRAIRCRLLLGVHGGGSRNAADAARWRRQSHAVGVAGDGTFTIVEASKFTRGTSIILHLKKFEEDDEVEDFTDKWVIERIVQAYSDFVAYPVILQRQGREGSRQAAEFDEADLDAAAFGGDRRGIQRVLQTHFARLERAAGDLVVSRGRPVRISGVAVHSVPGAHGSVLPTGKFGLHLYVRRVLIMEHCEELLPSYLRFIRGVVDSADLPLNVSRQRLQEDRHIAQIRKWLTKKVLDSLEEMQTKEPDKYVEVLEAVRPRLEGRRRASTSTTKTSCISLCLFRIFGGSGEADTLKEYVARMKQDQNSIYYLTGPSRRAVENSPHLEAFKRKGYEVLFMVDPVDEMFVQWVPEFEGKKLKSIAKGAADLGRTADLQGQRSGVFKADRDVCRRSLRIASKKSGFRRG